MRDKIAATVTQANEFTATDHAAGAISDEIVELGWKSRHRTRPDHPVRLICVEAKPHESYGGMRGPDCDGVLRLVTNRLDLPAEPIAEMYRLRWVIEMFFRTFKQLLGCGRSRCRRSRGLIGTLCSITKMEARGCPCH